MRKTDVQLFDEEWSRLLRSESSHVVVFAPNTEDVSLRAWGPSGEFIGEKVSYEFSSTQDFYSDSDERSEAE